VPDSRKDSALEEGKHMKRIEKTAIYIKGQRVGWVLPNGQFEPAPGWTVVNDQIVSVSSLEATHNLAGIGSEKRLQPVRTHGKRESQPRYLVGL
jgi:hypothetical protein